jgi:hypothetical protein
MLEFQLANPTLSKTCSVKKRLYTPGPTPVPETEWESQQLVVHRQKSLPLRGEGQDGVVSYR